MTLWSALLTIQLALTGTSCAQPFQSAPVLTIPSGISPQSPATDVYYGDTQPDANVPAPEAGDFSMTLRTDFLNRFVDRQYVESDDVAMQVMEANVRGVQTTKTLVNLESVASNPTARLHIVTNGTVTSNTVGYTPQAAISSTGNQTFRITKPVFFDGNRFLTKPGYGTLHAKQFPQSVNTMASGLPIVGRIGNRIAWNEVHRRMPRSDAIVVRQVANDVLPKVNAGVDSQLAKLNRDWRGLRKKMNAIVSGDDLKWTASSTQNSFSITLENRSVDRRTQTSRRPLLPELAKREAIAWVASHDGINHLLAKQPIRGLTVSDTVLQQIFLASRDIGTDYTRIPDLLRQKINLSAEPTMFSLKLADRDPLQLFFEDGLVTVHLRFQVLPAVGTASQVQLMKIQLGGESSSNGQWAIALRDLSVQPADSRQAPDAWTTLVSNQASQIADQIPPTVLPRQIDLQRFHEKMPLIRIHRIQSEGGQLRVSYSLDESDGTATSQHSRPNYRRK